MQSRKIKPLGAIEVIGKKGKKDEPFPIRGQKGQYFYIRVDHAEQLKEINDAYKSVYKTGVEPLEEVRIVGRGGIVGHRPFLLKGYEGRYLCILADHAEQLKRINDTYGELLAKKEEEKRRLAEERRRRLEEEKKRRLEEKRKKAKEAIERVRDAIKDARDIDALRYVPELMRKAEDLLAEMESAFSASKYDEIFDLVSKARELAERARVDASKKIEALKKPEKGKYVYCIIPSPGERKSFGNIGIENSGEVYTIDYRDIAAVVSDSPMKEYELTEENTEAHDEVMRKVLEDYTVAPAAFDQVFKNRKILKVVLSKAYKTIKEALKLLDNKVELGFKAILPREVAEPLDEEKRRDAEGWASEIFESLAKVAASSKKCRPFSDRMVLNAAFLVDRDKVKEFSEEMGKLSEKYKSLRIQYSGPWAPSNFVSIRLGGKR